MKMLNKIILSLYVGIAFYAFYTVIFVQGGALLWALFLWFSTPVIIAIIPVIYSSIYIFERMLPTLQNKNKIACLATLLTLGIDVIYVLLFGLGADLFTVQTSNIAPVELWGIAHTLPVIIMELFAGMMLYVWIVSNVERYLMRTEFVGQNAAIVKKTMLYRAIVRIAIVTILCIVWATTFFTFFNQMLRYVVWKNS